MASSIVPQIAISGSGFSNLAATNMTRSSATVYTYSYTVPSGTGTGTVSLSLGTDMSGNVVTSTPTGGATFSVSSSLVVVTGVSSTANNGSFKQSDVIPVTVTFDQSVTVTGTPKLTLETGSSDAVVNYSSGSPGNTLTFNYTVDAGHSSSDLDYKATNSLTLPVPSPGNVVVEDTSGESMKVAVSGSYAYVADKASGLAIINISDPTCQGTPVYEDTSGFSFCVVVIGNYAYVADGSSGLAVINISDPTNPGTPVYEDTNGTA